MTAIVGKHSWQEDQKQIEMILYCDKLSNLNKVQFICIILILQALNVSVIIFRNYNRQLVIKYTLVYR